MSNSWEHSKSNCVQIKLDVEVKSPFTIKCLIAFYLSSNSSTIEFIMLVPQDGAKEVDIS